MSECYEKLPHEECGSSDALQVFEDEDGSYSGYCFSCETYVPHPYIEIKLINNIQPTSQADTSTILEEIDTYPTIALPDRHLTAQTLEYFGIKIGVSELDGTTPTTVYFPYHRDIRSYGKVDDTVKAYKVRLLAPKKFWCVGDMKGVGLFGWDQALGTGAKRLFITEGELDAAALFQALCDKQRGTKWEDYLPAVVSLTRGASSAKKDMTDALVDIRSHFKEVVLCFDKDEAGELATEEAIKVYPLAQKAALPHKDPNASVISGHSGALANAVLFKSSIPKNTRLVNGTSLVQAGREQAKMGLSWPWEGLTKLTRGIRFGETYYLGAGVKMGKSEVVNTLAAHLITEHNLPVFLAKPEEANRKTVQMVFGKVAGKIFHDPDVEFDYEAYDKAAEVVGDRLFMLSLYQHLGWDSLRNDIMVAHGQGCKAVFIDPITNLVNGIASGETNTILQEIAQELAALAKDLNIVIFIFCHLKAPLSGPSHERGGTVHSAQFSGSRSMMRSCNTMLALEGSKDPDLSIEERNVRKLIILEDREFGASGYIRLFWDEKTGLFSEITDF